MGDVNGKAGSGGALKGPVPATALDRCRSEVDLAKRIPTWLTIDVLVIVISLAIIGIGIGIGIAP
jgi:hypothetical protein